MIGGVIKADRVRMAPAQVTTSSQMTTREALAQLRDLRDEKLRDWQTPGNHDDPECIFKLDYEAICIAIEAIESRMNRNQKKRQRKKQRKGALS